MSMSKMKDALEYYVLDGFVTEHVNILLDCFALYKYLVVFESDPHRQVRAKWGSSVVPELVGLRVQV
jgi:hypothetical protein